MADDKVVFDESLMPDEMPSSMAEIVIDERHIEFARRRWPDVSEAMQATRVRQAIWARFKHRLPHPDDPNRRLLGGPQPGSGPKVTKAAGARLVAAIDERYKEVEDAAFSPIAEGNDVADRHRAAMNLLKHSREEQREARDADEYARRTDDEVRRETAKMLAEMVRKGELSVEDIIGTAEEIPADQPQIEAA